MVFKQSWWGIFTNASKLRCQKFGCKRNSSWLGFGLAKLGGLGLCLGSKIGEKVKSLFFSNLGGELSKCMQNEMWKVWLQKELILVVFWLSQVWSLGLVFVPWLQNWWKSEVMVFEQSWWGIDGRSPSNQKSVQDQPCMKGNHKSV